MKNKIAAACLMFILLVGACTYFQHKKPDNIVVNYPMLDSAKLFSSWEVNNFPLSPDAVVYARKLYMNAIDLFVNKKDVKASLPLFLQSLRIAPQAFCYFKYADALFADGQYELASHAYAMSSALDNTMRADGGLGESRCDAMKGDSSNAIRELENAMEIYPFDTKQIENDKAFDKIRGMEQFKIILTKYNVSDDNRAQVLFGMFQKNFEKATLPYSIPPDSVTNHNGRQIDFRYADFIKDMTDGAFSRTTERDYQYMASLDLSPNFKTFVYRTVDFNGDTIYPVHQFLMTLNDDDSMIARQEIACACSPLTIKSAVIDSDNVVEVKEIVQTWKEDPLYKGYAGNEVVKQEVKGVTLYHVNADGRIEQIKERAPKTDTQASAQSEAPAQ